MQENFSVNVEAMNIYFNTLEKQCGAFEEIPGFEWTHLISSEETSHKTCSFVLDQVLESEYTACDELWQQVDYSVERLCESLGYAFIPVKESALEDLFKLNEVGHFLFPVFGILIGLIAWTLLKK